MMSPTLADHLGRLCPGFVPSGPPQYTGTSLLQPGILNGRPVIAKHPTDPRPWWQERCRHEIALYRTMRDSPAPVPTPDLVAADDQLPLLIVTALPGAPLHHDRYPPPGTVTIATTRRMLAALARLRTWTPDPASLIDDSDYPAQLARFVGGLLTTEELRILSDLHTRAPSHIDISHGDAHLANTCATESQVALLDFECTAWRPAGADHAKLYLFLAGNPAARRAVLADLTPTAIAGFWTALTLTACRELISHQRHPDAPCPRRRLRTLSADLRHALAVARQLHTRL